MHSRLEDTTLSSRSVYLDPNRTSPQRQGAANRAKELFEAPMQTITCPWQNKAAQRRKQRTVERRIAATLDTPWWPQRTQLGTDKVWYYGRSLSRVEAETTHDIEQEE